MKPDMEKIIAVLISLIEEQEHVEIDTTHLKRLQRENRLGGRKEVDKHDFWEIIKQRRRSRSSMRRSRNTCKRHSV